MKDTTYGLLDKTLAWSVHAFTASGIITAFLAVIAVSEHQFKEAMLWLMAAFVIDGVDGTFARKWQVKKVLPNFDGKTIDYVIDFATYAIIPAYFMYEADMFAPEWRFIAAAAVLYTSTFYYGKTNMVSDDLYFMGFPVLWNFVAFYLFFVYDFGYIINFNLILVLCVLHFVPIKFAYPSRTVKYFYPTLIITVLSVAADLVLLLVYPENNFWLTVIASLVVVYFTALTIYTTYFTK